jgi:hypothetical protein
VPLPRKATLGEEARSRRWLELNAVSPGSSSHLSSRTTKENKAKLDVKGTDICSGTA